MSDAKQSLFFTLADVVSEEILIEQLLEALEAYVTSKTKDNKDLLYTVMHVLLTKEAIEKEGGIDALSERVRRQQQGYELLTPKKQ